MLQNRFNMRTIIICPNGELRNAIERTASLHPAIRVAKSVDNYPEPDDFRRLIRVWAPDAVFVSIENTQAAERIARQLDAEFPSLQRVALSMTETPAEFRFALQLRMAELLVAPFDPDRFVDLLIRLSEHLKQNPATIGAIGELYAFLPAKGGVGASTIAANTVWALSKAPDCSVLLADFDLHSGLAGFTFGVEHGYSIKDATGRVRELDDDSWKNLIKKAGNVDLLLSGAPMLDEGMTHEQISSVLDFARKTYSVVAADLPETLDDRSLAVLREATRILLVTTCDLPSLRLARMKALALRRLELEDKARLLVNRVPTRMTFSEADIETSVGLPVFATFPCHYADVTLSARTAQASPKLTPAIKEFVEKLREKKLPGEKRSRFIERFALVPARYGFR
jgi:pilus assembly protein CpaE